MKTRNGFTLVELSIGTFLLSATVLVVSSLLWMIAVQRRSASQERTIGDLARQTDAIIRSGQKCQRLFKCNLNPADAAFVPTTSGTVNLPRGIAEFDGSCAAASSGSIAFSGGNPLGDRSLRINSLSLKDPAILAVANGPTTGTYTTVSYRLEADISDIASGPSSGSVDRKPVSFSSVTLVLDGAGQVVSCGNQGRGVASGTLNGSNCLRGIASFSGNDPVCAPNDPPCPSRPVTCASMENLRTGSVQAPPVYFGGLTPASSQTASGSVCEDVAVTGFTGFPPTSVNLSVVSVGNLNVGTTNGDFYVNANSVGQVNTNASGETAVVAGNVGAVFGSWSGTGTCIAAQNVASIQSQTDVSVYGQKTGGVYGTVGPVVMAGLGVSFYGQGFNFQGLTLTVGNLGLTDSRITTFAGYATSLNFDKVTSTGLVQISNTSTGTIKDSLIGGSFVVGNASSATMTNSTVTGLTQFTNNTTGQVSGSTLNGGLNMAVYVDLTVTDSVIIGGTTVSNMSQLKLRNTRVTGNMTTVGNLAEVTIENGSIFNGNIPLSNGAVLTVRSGARLNGNVSGAVWGSSGGPGILVDGTGSYIDEITVNGLNNPINISNNAVVNKLTVSNPLSATGTSFIVNCSGGGKILNKPSSTPTPITYNGGC